MKFVLSSVSIYACSKTIAYNFRLHPQNVSLQKWKAPFRGKPVKVSEKPHVSGNATIRDKVVENIIYFTNPLT